MKAVLWGLLAGGLVGLYLGDQILLRFYARRLGLPSVGGRRP